MTKRDAILAVTSLFVGGVLTSVLLLINENELHFPSNRTAPESSNIDSTRMSSSQQVFQQSAQVKIVPASSQQQGAKVPAPNRPPVVVSRPSLQVGQTTEKSAPQTASVVVAATTSTAVSTISTAGAGLQVALASTSPDSSAVLLESEADADLGDFVLSNHTKTPVEINYLSFKNIGASNDSVIKNAYLYSGDTLLAGSNNFSSGQFQFGTVYGLLFTIPAGQSYTVSFRADIADSSSGQQIGIQLASLVRDSVVSSQEAYSITPAVTSAYETVSIIPFQEQAQCATLANSAYQTQIQGWNQPNVWFKYLEKVHYNVVLKKCMYEFTVSITGTGGNAGTLYDGIIDAATNKTMLWLSEIKGSQTYTDMNNQSISAAKYNRELDYYMTN